MSDPAERPAMLRPYKHLDTCHFCGDRSYGDMQLFRECDDHDLPILGLGGLLVLCAAKKCDRKLVAHPKLFVEETGAPGHFPICAECRWRDGLMCTHPHLRANGGRGLAVTMDDMRGVFLCGPDGAVPMLRRARDCDGLSNVAALAGGGGPR